MKIEYNTCDRCGTRIEYTGWTSFLYGLQPKKIKWRKIFNGNPSGYVTAISASNYVRPVRNC